MSALGGVLLGAAVTQAGYFAGWIYSRARYRRRLPKPIEAICGCKHSLAEHDPATNACHHVTLKESGYSGGERLFKKVPCQCRQYVGPRPIEQMFALPSLPPAEE